MIDRYLIPRPLHPFAWWGFALIVAVAASFTLNPFVLCGLLAVITFVTLARRGDNPWAAGFRYYWYLGLFMIVVRIAFRVLLGGGDGPTILLDLPEIPLPSFVAGIRLLGPISLESVLHGCYDGLRLATIIISIGAANSLANPKRLLAALPASLYELGTVLVVAVSVFPQLGDSIRRVLRVRKLRRAAPVKNRRQRLGVVESIIVPVLSDALERSTSLAASMEARGYGRSGRASLGERNQATGLGFAGVALLSVWAYFLLARPKLGVLWRGELLGIDVPVKLETVLLWALLAAGLLSLGAAMRTIGRNAERTKYRSDPWGLAEWIVVGTALVLLLICWATPRAVLYPNIIPLTMPALTPALMLGLLVAALPAVATPEPALAPVAEAA